MCYKGGVTDPDYCVLKFTAEKGSAPPWSADIYQMIIWVIAVYHTVKKVNPIKRFLLLF